MRWNCQVILTETLLLQPSYYVVSQTHLFDWKPRVSFGDVSVLEKKEMRQDWKIAQGGTYMMSDPKNHSTTYATLTTLPICQIVFLKQFLNLWTQIKGIGV